MVCLNLRPPPQSTYVSYTYTVACHAWLTSPTRGSEPLENWFKVFLKQIRILRVQFDSVFFFIHSKMLVKAGSEVWF